MKTLLVTLAAVLTCLNAYAADSASGVTAAGTLQQNDTVIFFTQTNKMKDIESRDAEVVAPVLSRFTYKGVDTNNNLRFNSQNRKDCKAPFGWVPDWLLNSIGSSDSDGWCTFNNSASGEVHRNKQYKISSDDFKYVDYVRVHWTSGILVIPYKYVPSNHELAKGNFTLGPYFGYTTSWLNTETTFALSAGLTSVAVPVLQNGVATSVEKQGLSLSTGLLFKLGGVNGGFLLGTDQLGSNSQYQNNGKIWIGIFVGSGFSS